MSKRSPLLGRKPGAQFREFGASGATWDRTSIAAALSPGEEITANGMHAFLGPDAVLRSRQRSP